MLNNLTSGKSFEEKYIDQGFFEYDNEGFSITYEDFFKYLRWNDITQLNVFKRDLITIDRIEMEIVYGDKSFLISEDLPGWYQFNQRLECALPSIMNDWYSTIVQPPFATNWTTIYNKS